MSSNLARLSAFVTRRATLRKRSLPLALAVIVALAGNAAGAATEIVCPATPLSS